MNGYSEIAAYGTGIYLVFLWNITIN